MALTYYPGLKPQAGVPLPAADPNDAALSTKNVAIPAMVILDGSGNQVTSFGGGGGGASTIANGADVAEGTTTDTAYSDGTGAAAGTLVALNKGQYKLLAGGVPALGYASSTTPTAATAGANKEAWVTLNGAVVGAISTTQVGLDGFGNTQGAQLKNSDGTNSPLFIMPLVYDPALTTWQRQRGTVDGMSMLMALGSTAVGGAAATTVLGSAANQYKAAAGNIGSLNIVNSSVAGFVVVLDVATAPTAGATITAAQLKYCFPIVANGALDKVWQVPLNMTSGIHVAVLTSPTTYTTVGTAPLTMSAQYK